MMACADLTIFSMLASSLESATMTPAPVAPTSRRTPSTFSLFLPAAAHLTPEEALVR
jgi:hypothetical protein